MGNNKYKTKYEFWKLAILEELYRKEKTIVVIHNKIENTISVYDIIKGKKTIQPTAKDLDNIFSSPLLSTIVNINNIQEFYNSLTKDKQKVFWDNLSKGTVWNKFWLKKTNKIE